MDTASRLARISVTQPELRRHVPGGQAALRDAQVGESDTRARDVLELEGEEGRRRELWRSHQVTPDPKGMDSKLDLGEVGMTRIGRNHGHRLRIAIVGTIPPLEVPTERLVSVDVDLETRIVAVQVLRTPVVVEDPDLAEPQVVLSHIRLVPWPGIFLPIFVHVGATSLTSSAPRFGASSAIGAACGLGATRARHASGGSAASRAHRTSRWSHAPSGEPASSTHATTGTHEASRPNTSSWSGMGSTSADRASCTWPLPPGRCAATHVASPSRACTSGACPTRGTPSKRALTVSSHSRRRAAGAACQAGGTVTATRQKE